MNYNIIIIGILIIFVILIIILVVGIASYHGKMRQLDEICGKDTECDVGLVCDNGRCKIPINGNCESLSMCVSSATQCREGTCIDNPISGFLGPCSLFQLCEEQYVCNGGVCKAINGAKCNQNSDCTTGLICFDNICIENPSTLLEGCSENLPCKNNLTCDMSSGIGICKLKPGEKCKSDNECSFKHICDNICIPTPFIGDKCTSDNRCAIGLTCSDSFVLQNTTVIDANENPLIIFKYNGRIIDITGFKNNINGQECLLILLDTQDFVIIKNEKETNITSNLNNITTIVNFCNIIYALSGNRLYRAVIGTTIRWVSVPWAPTNVTFISVTNDNECIWIQSLNNGITRGQLFYCDINNNNNNNNDSFIINSLNPTLISTEIIKDINRIYGKSSVTYIDLSTIDDTGFLVPLCKKIIDIITGAFLNNGTLIRITTKASGKYKNVRIIFGKSYFITNRYCTK